MILYITIRIKRLLPKFWKICTLKYDVVSLLLRHKSKFDRGKNLVIFTSNDDILGKVGAENEHIYKG